MNFKDRYQYNPKTDLLGKGGFSQVFKAYDSLLERVVALKFFYNTDQSKYDILSEIRKIIRLNHPNIAMYYDVTSVETPDFHGDIQLTQVGIMEYINSGEIKTFLEKNSHDPSLLRKLLIDVLHGLEYLHRNGIIHRDLKPANILVHVDEGAPVAKIADFGISKNVDAATGGQSSQVMGTIEYMAPEQFNAARYGLEGKIGTNLDLWSFGIMVYELITGRSLFGVRGTNTGSEQIMNNILSDELPDDIYSLPQPYGDVILACLVKNAAERVRTASEVIGLFDGTAPVSTVETTVLPSHLREKAKTITPGAKQSGKISGNVRQNIPQKKGRGRILLAILVSFAALIGYFLLNRYTDLNKTTVQGKEASRPVIPSGMILVSGGRFMMGSDGVENGKDATPRHEVEVDSFLMCDHEVTNQEFADFLNKYGSDKIKSDDFAGELMIEPDPMGLVRTGGGAWRPSPEKEQHPVVNVSWFGAWCYAKFKGGRLPTEAEWEFAARGGRLTKGYKYPGGNDPLRLGWHEINASKKTQSVRQLAANELGIYDLGGNVFEWCYDWYNDKTYKTKTQQKNPSGPSSGEFRVIRGGSWNSVKGSLTSTFRNCEKPTDVSNQIGFRFVMPYPSTKKK
jgi:formylglycine-generating enzyme required for sulfatase activity